MFASFITPVPPSITPSWQRTDRIVPKNNFPSNKKACIPPCLRDCTYSPSNLAFSGISSSSLPLIWARPVKPGKISFAPYFSRSATRSSWFHNAGLGPITLIFPRKISQIWGSSSRLVFRSTLPTFVIYCSGRSNWCVGTSWGVDIFILLNLCRLKNALPFPTRFCVKKTGPGSSI